MSTRDDGQSTQGDALLGTLLAGRYRIEALIGSGGMGAVYRAEHVHMRKAVALKVLHKEMTAFPEVVARFEREAVAAARIEHPHVVSASDFGQLEDGSFYLVLEFIEGRSLAKLVEQTGALAPERALRITRQIVEALHAAHGVGIVHRDLKPDNVMLLAKEEEPDFVKVLDFGIAKIKVEDTTEQPQLTQIGTVFGTPEYMSPEQARGELVDARADLYTVGVILFEMLTGASPFKDEDLVVVLTRHLTAAPPPLPTHIDPMIRDLTLLLLRKSREERVQSAQELLERIDVILSAPGSAAGFAGEPSSGALLAARASADLEAFSTDRTGGYAPTILGETTPLSMTRGPAEESWIERPIQLGARKLPLWHLGVGAFATVLTITTLIVLGSSLLFGKHEASTVQDDASKSTVAKDSELAQLILRAEAGDEAALAELGARPEAKRASGEWLALGRGYAKLNRLSESLAAYQGGVQSNSELSSDPRLLADVHRAALETRSSDAALKFALASLDAPGVDLVYGVWESSKSMPNRAPLTKQTRAYLDDESVRAKASPALKVLLEAGKAQKEGCASVKRWLARASTQADARVLPALKRFEDRRGCGFLGLSDCYACLRSGKDLSTTSASVAARPGPQFD